MKRSRFSNKPRKPLKRVGFKKRAKTRPKRRIKRSEATPAWIRAIPLGSHGSGHLQQRLWRLTSDYCRIRDWYRWGNKDVASDRIIPDWRSGQGGHFISYTACRGIFKFDESNIHLQHGYSNKFPTRETIKHFEEELARRYGKEYVAGLEIANRETPLPIRNEDVLKEIEWYLNDFKNLPEQPDYYERVIKLKKEHGTT